MTEQEQYGTTKTAEPIPVPHDRPFVTSTPNPTAAPKQIALRAYNAIVRKDLLARHRQHGRMAEAAG
jgi:hypothetical protein